MAEADVFLRVHRGAPREGMRSFVDLLAGTRYSKVRAGLQTSLVPDTERSFDWVDGVIGARFQAPLSAKVAIGGPRTWPDSAPTSPGRSTPTCRPAPHLTITRYSCSMELETAP